MSHCFELSHSEYKWNKINEIAEYFLNNSKRYNNYKNNKKSFCQK